MTVADIGVFGDAVPRGGNAGGAVSNVGLALHRLGIPTRLMGKIDCQGGNTQIGKVLSETRREAVASGVRALVFVGDAMEEGG